MHTVNATTARKQIFQLLEEVNLSHHPVSISGKNPAILVSEADWRDIQETLYLLNIPGMRDSVIEGMALPPDQCSDEVKW